MGSNIATIYKCYLGGHLFYRTYIIDNFILSGGKCFFKTYGTKIDSISGFISKGEAIGLY